MTVIEMNALKEEVEESENIITKIENEVDSYYYLQKLNENLDDILALQAKVSIKTAEIDAWSQLLMSELGQKLSQFITKIERDTTVQRDAVVDRHFILYKVNSQYGDFMSGDYLLWYNQERVFEIFNEFGDYKIAINTDGSINKLILEAIDNVDYVIPSLIFK
ncbi:MAG: hypothetical protein ABF709_09490 [Leuconostoc pseudomesenteroides]|uniref:hypothetical protein n=1 Tax=Leuconostoc pseudomesenteroides TaxID=33968 RepID=UPI00301B8F7B